MSRILFAYRCPSRWFTAKAEYRRPMQRPLRTQRPRRAPHQARRIRNRNGIEVTPTKAACTQASSRRIKTFVAYAADGLDVFAACNLREPRRRNAHESQSEKPPRPNEGHRCHQRQTPRFRRTSSQWQESADVSGSPHPKNPPRKRGRLYGANPLRKRSPVAGPHRPHANACPQHRGAPRAEDPHMMTASSRSL